MHRDKDCHDIVLQLLIVLIVLVDADFNLVDCILKLASKKYCLGT